MAVTYDDATVAYNTALVTYDGDGGAGTMTGAVAETSSMTGDLTKTSTMTGTITY